MNTTKGYYSLLQYCPDRSRMEAVNVGIVLFAPEINFLRAKVSNTNDRVRRFFGNYSFDNTWLRQAKEAVVERMDYEKQYIKDRNAFEKFIQTRANELILSDIKPVRVTSPEEQLDALFHELVTHEKQQTGRRSIVRQIDKAFRSEKFNHRMLFNRRVEVPVVEKQIDIPYTFMNGRPNLVKPQEFNGKNIDRAMTLAVEGEFLQDADYKFILIPKIVQSVKQEHNLRTTLQEVFKRQNIETVWPENYAEFIEKVDKVAKPVDSIT